MILLKILIALGVSHYWPSIDEYRTLHGVKRACLELQSRFVSIHPMLPVLLILLPVLIVSALLQLMLAKHHQGLLDIFLSTVVFWGCLCPLLSHVSHPTENLWRAHEHQFAAIFWFATVGITGPVLYRMVILLDEIMPSDFLAEVHGLLAWPSSRLTAVLYALVGDFSPSFHVLQKEIWQKGQSRKLLTDTGLAALNIEYDAGEGQSQAIEGLIRRTRVAWIVVIALLTIGFIWL